MRVTKISIQGFRAFKDTTEVHLGDLTTIVGKNDTGKSSIIHALDIFFNDSPDDDDFNRDQSAEDPIVIQVSFTDLPDSIQLEEDIDTDLETENLLDTRHNLTIRKTYARKNPKLLTSWKTLWIPNIRTFVLLKKHNLTIGENL